MDADEFSEKLLRLMPNLNEMLASGLSVRHCERVCSSFVVPRIKENDAGIQDPLLDLVTNFDVSRLEICSVRFDLTHTIDYRPNNRTTMFATDDADYLVIDNETHEIAVVDSQSDGYVIGYCAKDGAHFLDALLEMARRIERASRTFHYPIDPHNLPAMDRCEDAKACAEKAGGDKYLWFYQVALGCDLNE
jgi:hypothetical protein